MATVTTMRYTADGQLASLIDPSGRVTSYGHDSLGRSVLVTQPDPNGAAPLSAPVTAREYDAAGNLLSETDDLDYTISYRR